MSESIKFRVIVGSYEHSLLCLSVSLPIKANKDENDIREPHFQTIFHFTAHALSIRSIDIAKRYLVTGSNDEHIRIYDLQKRKELGTLLQHQGSITKLVFSDEILNNNKDIDNDTNKSIYPLHKNGKWLLSASDDGNIFIWRTKDWEKFGILKGHKGSINDLAIHPSGKIAVSVGSDQTIRLWNLMTAKKASLLKLKGALTRGQQGEFIKFDSTGEFFIIGFRDRLMIWKTREAKLVNLVKTDKIIMDIKFIVLNDSIEYLIICFNDGSINFYEFNKNLFFNENIDKIDGSDLEKLGNPKFSLQGHASRVKGISFFKEIKNNITYLFMTSISSDGKIVIWNLDSKIMDQVAVYSTGERLNVVVCVEESIEHTSTMKPIFNPNDQDIKDIATDSEYESDGSSLAHLLKGRKKKSAKKQRRERNKLLKVEME